MAGRVLPWGCHWTCKIQLRIKKETYITSTSKSLTLSYVYRTFCLVYTILYHTTLYTCLYIVCSLWKMFLHLLMCTYSCVATLIPSISSAFIGKIRGGEGKQPGELYQMIHDTANIKGSRQIYRETREPR